MVHFVLLRKRMTDVITSAVVWVYYSKTEHTNNFDVQRSQNERQTKREFIRRLLRVLQSND